MFPVGNGQTYYNNATSQQNMQQAPNQQWTSVPNNQALPIQPTMQYYGQPQPGKSYYIPNSHYNQPNEYIQQPIQVTNYPKQINHVLSTSEEEIEEDGETSTQSPNKINWQVQRNKRRKTNVTNQHNTMVVDELPTRNRYQVLTNNTQDESGENAGTTSETIPKPHPKPPPIFVYDVVNYPKMVEQLKEIAEVEHYSTKSLANNVVKINCNTPEIYRRMITYMKERNIMYHSYQIKEDRAYRVVIKYLHPSVQTADIATELLQYGHKVRNIINARHHRTKESLNIFVDLEPSDNNKEVYNIDRLQNKLIRIEPPRKFNTVIQCTRCQLYGHSKTYCNRPFLCVKCGGAHNSTTCKKSNNTPAKCGLCGGSHPANYKGCDYYRNIKRSNKVITNKPINQQKVHAPMIDWNEFPPMPIIPSGQSTNTHLNKRSYAEVTKNDSRYNNTQPASIDNNQLTLMRFLDEFKQMFNQLIQQNSTVLNMLTALINKLK